MQVTSSDCSSAVQHSFVFGRRHRALETLPAALQRGAVAHGGGRGQRQRCGTSPLPAPAPPNHPPPPPPPPCPCQASIEALDKRMRECGWAQKFCAAMAALQVSCLPPLLCRGRVLNTHVATGGQRGARQQRRRLCLPRRTAAAALGAQRGEFYHAGYTLLPPPAACTLLTRACRAVCGLGL